MAGINVLLYFVIGGVALWLGGEAIVRGSVSLALRHGVSQIVVGLTIVGFATSAPEFFVSLLAALQNNPEIALGNVIGSNIANLGLVLGGAALIFPLTVHKSVIRQEVLFLIAAAGLTWLLAANNSISRWEGLLLLAGLLVFIAYCISRARNPRPTDKLSAPDLNTTLLKYPWLDFLYLILGLTGLMLGAKLFVLGAVGTARLLGVSEFLIGLSLVALGTSLPEAAAAIVSVLRRKTDLALGTVIGSNLFNLLMILGTVAVCRPIPTSPASVKFDFPVVVGLSLLLVPLARSQNKISRLEGGILLLLYCSYIAIITWRG